MATKHNPFDKGNKAADVIAEDAQRKQNSRTDNPIATYDKEDEENIEKVEDIDYSALDEEE
jgi:hypothetical protein